MKTYRISSSGRRTALILLVAALIIWFFAFWTLVLMLIWSLGSKACLPDPTKTCSGAFLGFGTSPRPRDFLYLAVNGVFANTPPDLIAHSGYAHLAQVLELITGVALVTVKGGEFLTRKRSSK